MRLGRIIDAPTSKITARKSARCRLEDVSEAEIMILLQILALTENAQTITCLCIRYSTASIEIPRRIMSRHPKSINFCAL
jgi:hypothetical protein